MWAQSVNWKIILSYYISGIPVDLVRDVYKRQENMFIMVPTRVEVSSDLAERYGYADDVTDGVSALDVLVKYHELRCV